ncbi:MAG: YgjP-like metallopeptidase domain-containing protein [Geothrix sp.]|uniref:YgjP-like metallopeptidase domain-containing protein n=1 Tax=Geothrix sp. TaxID=1962974 RepID=UPI003BAFE377
MMPPSATPLPYLEGYSPAVQARVRELLAQGQLGPYLSSRYGEAHEVRNDKTLFQAAVALKDRFMRNTAPLNKVVYDSKLQLLSHALGTLTSASRVQGSRLKASREIRVASVFRDAPAPFLKMILVHELAHLKEREHNKAFYQLCIHMEPDYFQLEFDLRLYLTHREACAAAEVVPIR